LRLDNEKEVLLGKPLSKQQEFFIALCCEDITYAQIAIKMGHKSVRTIEGYRDEVYAKLGLHSRIGLMRYAIRSGIISFDDIVNEKV